MNIFEGIDEVDYTNIKKPRFLSTRDFYGLNIIVN